MVRPGCSTALALGLVLLSTIAGAADPAPSSTPSPHHPRLDPGPAPAWSPGQEFLLGGIQVNEPNHDRWIGALDDVGMNTVAVTVYAKQGNWNEAHLWWEAEEPSVLAEIRAAKAAGLRVVLILRVALDHKFPANEFLWHGMILPRGNEAITDWFEQYGDFAVQWAEVAQREGVDLFGIGSEMNALNDTRRVRRWSAMRNFWGYYLYERRFRHRTRRFADELQSKHLWVRGYPNYPDVEGYLDARFAKTKAWAKETHLRKQRRRLRRLNERADVLLQGWHGLIDRVRLAYDGPLTYAANFDSYHEVGFWDRLDVIGINAYFSLRGGVGKGQIEPADAERFRRRWARIFGRIDGFRRQAGIEDKPVVFTEAGYTFRRHSTVEPWAHGGFSVVGWGTRRRNLVIWSEEPVDYRERALALESLAALRAEQSLPLTGILYWKLSTLKQHEAIEPFVMHVGPDSSDPLQRSLLRFLEADPARYNPVEAGGFR